MNENKDLIIEEIFTLAVKNHQNNKLDIAYDLYNQVLKVDPKYASAHNNLGTIFKANLDNPKAKICYEKAIEIDKFYHY